MSKENVDVVRKQLNKNVEVVESTFSNACLQLLGYGFCGINKENGWVQLLLEIATMPGEQLDDDVDIKVNFYDEEGIIIYSNNLHVYCEDFSGYDTVNMYLNENGLAFNAVKCKIFAKKH